MFGALVAAVVLLLGPLAAKAGVADIATTPLAAATTGSVRANLMFVLDDSGSMGSRLPARQRQHQKCLFRRCGDERCVL